MPIGQEEYPGQITKSAERCRPDYEGMLEQAKKEGERAEKLLNAFYDYFESTAFYISTNANKSYTVHEFIGVLVMDTKKAGKQVEVIREMIAKEEV